MVPARSAVFGGSGVFLVTGDGPSAAKSPDAMSWTALPPNACGGYYASGNGTIVAVYGTQTCRTVDDGATWSTADLGGSTTAAFTFANGLVQWSGAEFLAWGATDAPSMFRSSDGASWTPVPLRVRHLVNGSIVEEAGPVLDGAVGRAGNGSFVASSGSYDTQRFYRSADGIVWDELDQGAYVRSHPMTRFAWAAMDPTQLCPGH